ncbi:MAG: hypothetical protein BA066_04975 [Candidatus Korarchaeota archaeon NZ13-K]|nr:MAG: hypothetical protein BA066_04975 [Candidatus Korarchaeota archaeon NZ13-K]
MSQKAPKILLYYVGILLIIAGIIAVLGQIYNIYVLPPKKQIPTDLFNYTIAGLLILGIIFTIFGRVKGS